jgi:hypothetical protein
MSTFAAPERVYVVNDTNQVNPVFRNALGNVVTVFNANHTVDASPIFTNLKKEEVKVALKTLPVLGVAQQGTLTFNAGALAGDNIRVRVVFDSIEQLGTDIASVNNRTNYVVDYVADSNLTSAQLATKIKNLFDATVQDQPYPFTTTVTGATITFVASNVGFRFEVFAIGANATYTTTVQPVTPVGTYEAILPRVNNMQAHGNLQKLPIGELLERPQVGTNYVTYYWETETEESIGGHSAHSAKAVRFHRYRVFVKDSLTALITELDKIVP